MSKICLPRTAVATRPTTMNRIEAVIAMYFLPRKSTFVTPSSFVIRKVEIRRLRSQMSNTTRAQNTAVYMLIRMPKVSVMAKPRIWSVPMTYITTAVISVVKFESMMVTMARSNPLRIAIRKAAPRSSSSRMRS